ncbi:MAG: response regulator [Planctomycetota bacterium]
MTIRSQNSTEPIETPIVSPELNPFVFPRPSDEAVRNSRILVVDDEVATVDSIESQLRRAGFVSVEGLTNSEHVLEKARQWKPGLILLDLRLRPVNGLEVLRHLRKDEITNDVPVIIVSSVVNELTTVTALNLGATDFLYKPVRAGELVARARNALSEKVFRDLANEKTRQLESDLLSDPLTQVANRRAFEYEITRRLSDWARHRTPVSLAMIDVDDFKAINDRMGHQYGDEALQAVANAVVASTRSMDLVARYGGDEFAVIMPTSGPHEAREACERMRQRVEDLGIGGVREIAFSVSVGVSTAMAGDKPQTLMQRADAALYEAKRDGRNRSYFNDGTASRPATTLKQTPIQPLDVQRDARKSPELTTIAIVDDEPSTILTAKKYLKEAGYANFLEVTDATKAFDVIQSEMPDIVMLDIHMPVVGGLEILERLREDRRTSNVPVLIFTSDRKSDAKVHALNLGATDFLNKPIDPSELLARVNNTLLVKARMDDLASHSERLEGQVHERTIELEATRREAIQCLARAAELRDDQTGQHVIRVGKYARIIAEGLGFSSTQAEWLELAAQLHDVGKIGIPDSVLRKEGPLDDDEYRLIKTHCRTGEEIIRREGDESKEERLAGVHTQSGMQVFRDCHSPLMRMAASIAATHHEKWDGSGYPAGLKGNDIPIEGRITAVADVFDALSTRRPYKEAIPLLQCFEILEEGRGGHFDPRVLTAFFDRREEVIRTFQHFADS